MYKVGLVGVGGISGAHISAWKTVGEDAQITALCDVRKEQMKDYPDKNCYTDFDEMLEKEDLDIIDICLPTFLHADYAVRAMEKGLNVICEKPISLDKKDVRRLYECAGKNHVRFMVAQVIRFWPEYMALKEIIDSGKYGRVLSGTMNRLGNCPGWSWSNWMRSEDHSGLVPYDLHVHDLDFMVYTFGSPRKFQSFRAKDRGQDVIHVVYEFDGFYIAAEAAWYAAAYPFQASFRFQFERAVVENVGNRLTVYETDGKSYCPIESEAAGDTGSINLPRSDGYANEIRYFVDCMKSEKNPDLIKAEELEAVIDILNSL